MEQKSIISNKILAIDDKEVHLVNLIPFIEKTLPTIEIIIAHSIEDGIRKALKILPDIILLDCFMSGINGLEVCKKLKANELTRNIPIIIVTGKSTGSNFIKEALECGVDIFISKSDEGPEFIAQLKLLLRMKQSEDKLREENEHLKGYLEQSYKRCQELEMAAYIGYWEYDLITNRTTWSDNLYRILGLKKGEIEPGFEEYIKRIHPDDVHLVHEYKKRMKQEKRSVEFEVRYLQSDKTIYVLNRIIPEYKNGQLVKYYGINMDITERILKNKELAQKTYDLCERIKELNCLYGISKLFEKPGISLEEMLQGTVELIPPSWQYPEITCARIFLDGQDYKTDNFKETAWKQACDIKVHQEKIGVLEVFYLEERPEIFEGPFLKEERRLINAITERLGKATSRVITEKALKKSERKYQDLYDNAPDMFISVETKTAKILHCNQKLATTLGYSKEEIEGQLISFLYHPDCKKDAAKAFDSFQETGKVQNVELILKRKDGSKIYVNLNSSAIYDEYGKIIASRTIYRDITEKKFADEELAQRTYDLSKRVKELNCLYDVSKLINKSGISLEDILQETVDLIPPAYRYPEITYARVTVQGKKYKSANFQETTWRQACDIEVNKGKVGILEVYCLGKGAENHEGPFLEEERNLVNAIAELLGKTTARIIIEKELRESEERYRNLFESTTDAISLFDENGFFDCNRAALEMFGMLDKSEFLAKNPSEMSPPQQADGSDSLTLSIQKINEAFKNGISQFEWIHRRKNGDNFYADVRLTKFLLNGKPVLQANLRDITDRKRDEEKIRESEEKYRTLFEESKDVIFFSTPGGNFVDINPAGVELFGYSSKEELLKIDLFRDFYVNSQDRDRFIKNIEKNGFVKDFEFKIKRKDGTQLTVILSANVVKNKNGDIIAYRGIIRDISQRVLDEQLLKKMNDELRETNKKLNQAQASLYQQGKLASIGQLAAGVAHEINNPLGFVSSNFSTLEKYFKSIKEYFQLIEDLILKIPENPCREVQEAVEKINEQRRKIGVDFIMDDTCDIFSESYEGYDRIKNIVENLRSFSRVDYENKIEKYDINQAIENTLIVARNEIKYAANIETEFSNIPLIECRGDEINQVLLNIIVNAAQAIKSRNLERMGIIKIKTYEKEKYVFCEIADNGPGIPDNIIDKIFDPFFTTKEVGKGTGLGLNICHDIVINKHKGDLTVKSEIGRGSTFFLKLPIKSTFKNRDETR